MSLLASLSRKSTHSQQLLLLQSSSSQSALPILRHLIASRNPPSRTLLFCLLYPPSALVQPDSSEQVQIHDYLSDIPGYCERNDDIRKPILQAIEAIPGPLDIVIDSAGTLASDLGSDAEAYNFLHKLMAIVRSRAGSSRLILHIISPSPLCSLLTQATFSPSLTHIITHPTALLTHLASAYLTLPPPLSPEAKFWSVFLPFSERSYELEHLVYGPDGEGYGTYDEMVVEILVRSGGQGALRRRGVERSLEGWNMIRGVPCEVSALSSLKKLYSTKKTADEAAPDPMKNVSFNLNLTPSQQLSRAQVPLPYAHDGTKERQGTPQNAAIFYDPDSADDMDDDDPDEDLDI